MKILTVGDIVGENAVKWVKNILPQIKEEQKIDFCIINGENAAGGMGITKKIMDDLLTAGADVVTMGNHTWGKKDIFTFIDHPQLIRPANYIEGIQGKGYGIYSCKGKKMAVINLIGRTSMAVLSENPFAVAKKICNELKKRVDFMIVDFHAEATAEKIAMGYFLDGISNIVYGTHTHVQTADERVLPKGTGYITDIGMTGPKYSVIGMDVDVSLKRFLTCMPEKYKMAQGECIFNGCIFELNDNTGKIEGITRYNR